MAAGSSLALAGINAAEASLARRDQRGRSEPSSSELTRPKKAYLAGSKAAEASLARRKCRSEPSSSES
eukprot:3723927-Pleurochrysis_carterae.AAC.1